MIRRAAYLLAVTCALCAAAADAQTQAETAGRVFAAHCFSPYLTAQRVQQLRASGGARIDFYDLRPFSDADPSPVTGRAATPGTDRRCEVAFDGRAPAQAADWISTGIAREGLASRLVDVPDSFTLMAGTTFKGAAQLNPNRIAVVQAGVRPGPNGPETYMSVERLTPLDGSQ